VYDNLQDKDVIVSEVWPGMDISIKNNELLIEVSAMYDSYSKHDGKYFGLSKDRLWCMKSSMVPKENFDKNVKIDMCIDTSTHEVVMLVIS
jgi:hypothetical protein